MKFEDYFMHAKNNITIIGINPIASLLENNTLFFKDLLTANNNLTMIILYESDSENFNISLCTDTEASIERISYSILNVHKSRISGQRKGTGFIKGVIEHCDNEYIVEELKARISVKQINLRLPVRIIVIDSEIWCCIVTNTKPSINSYFRVDEGSNLYEYLKSFAEFYTEHKGGNKYLSEPGEELIQMYDKNDIPRGIYPRSCFYTTEYQRYSVWGFVFNRNGDILLHQRSKTTKDGRGLWDKSIGGHVEIGDSSTTITAKRELVEELFLPEAEYTKYMKAHLGDIIDFGEWNPKKRPEICFKESFRGLDKSDWIMFRATDEKGKPLIVKRISMRRIHDEDGNITFKNTMFISDIYLFIAPIDFIDTHDQMKSLLMNAEKAGAASDHRIISIDDLRYWIKDKDKDNIHLETFTDDILHINMQYRGLLEGFSEFVKYIKDK